MSLKSDHHRPGEWLLHRLFVVLAFAASAAAAFAQQEPRPPGTIRRLGTAQFRHGSRVQCIGFSPDDRHIASGGGNDPVRIWDAATGEQVKELKEPWASTLIYSSRGTRLITANAFKTVREWDLSTGAEVAQLKGHDSALTCMTISKDNTLLATGDQSGAVILWELFLSPKQVQRLTGHAGEITAVAFSPSGRTLASASSDRTIRLWNAENGTLLRTLDGGCAVSAVVFLNDNTVASAGDDNQIRTWDLEGKQTGAWTGHEDAITTLLITPDGKKVISGARDRSLRLWNPAEGKQIGRIACHLGDCDAVALSHDGKTLVAGGVNNTIRRWQLESGKELGEVEGHRSPVSRIALSSDGRVLASAGYTGDIRLWDAVNGAPLRSWQNPAAGEILLAHAPDGRTLASAVDADGVRLWSLPAGTARGHLQHDGSDPILCLAFAPDSKALAIGHRSGAVRVWDPAQIKLVSELKYMGPVYALAYSDDGSTLAVSGGKVVALWETATGKQLRQFGPKETVLLPAVACLAFAPDGKMLATGSFDSVIRIWDITSGQMLHVAEGHTSAVHSLAFSTDGRRLASASFDGTVRLWEAHGGRQVAFWRGHRGPVSSVALAPNGRTLFSGGADTSVLAWDVTGKSPAGVLPGGKLAAPELQAGWQALASLNANEANYVIWNMVGAAAESLPFLDGTIFLLDQEKLAKQIRDLDSEVYRVREKASMELANYGRWIEPNLQARLKDPGSEETRQRVNRLLEKLQAAGAISREQEVLRFRRAMLILEQDGSSPARALLRKIISNGPEPYLQDEARATLQRLEAR